MKSPRLAVMVAVTISAVMVAVTMAIIMTVLVAVTIVRAVTVLAAVTVKQGRKIFTAAFGTAVAVAVDGGREGLHVHGRGNMCVHDFVCFFVLCIHD